MKTQAEPQETAPGEVLQKPKLSYWRRIGGGSLFVSIVLHAVLLAVGIVWIVQTIDPAPERKDPTFIPKGSGGPSPQAAIPRPKDTQRVMSQASRIAAQGVETSFTLPQPEANSSTNALASLSLGSTGANDLGRAGFAPGNNPGSGLNALDSEGILNPFGMQDPNRDALVGTFYDFKQTPDRKPTDLTPDGMHEAVQEFGRRNWREQSLSKFYPLSQKVYQTKIYIPYMPANQAPAAFNAEKEVEPSRWIIVYRGNVIAPKSGKFRFVGAADDMIAVRFNDKAVLDYGFSRVYRGDESPMEKDHPKYPYANAKQYERMGGIGAGPEFRVIAGRSYPIEILIGEVPGGIFCATLMIEEIGATYEKTPEGSPILPLFRTDSSVPATSTDDCAIPYDPKGPVWRIAGSGPRMDI